MASFPSLIDAFFYEAERRDVAPETQKGAFLNQESTKQEGVLSGLEPYRPFAPSKLTLCFRRALQPASHRRINCFAKRRVISSWLAAACACSASRGHAQYLLDRG